MNEIQDAVFMHFVTSIQQTLL